MATETLRFDGHDASADAYVRIFNASGQVFDFDDSTFKALASCTTPYQTSTERGDLDGTAFSAYDNAIDLALLNDLPTPQRFTAKWFDNASPADSDVAVSGALDFTVQSGKLGERATIPCFDQNVKSTSGLAAQQAAWLDEEGAVVALSSIGGTAFTADAGTDVITSNGHGLSNGQAIVVRGGDLPAGLADGNIVFVRDATTNTFKAAATSGGSAIDLTDAGSGTMTWHRPTVQIVIREHEAGSDDHDDTYGPEYLANDGASPAVVLDDVFEPLRISTTMPSTPLLREIVSGSMIRGEFLKDEFAAMTSRTRRNVAKAINIGLAQGESIDSIVRRVRARP